MSSVTHPLQHYIHRIMPDALEEHDDDEKVSINSRNIINLQFAEDIEML